MGVAYPSNKGMPRPLVSTGTIYQTYKSSRVLASLAYIELANKLLMLEYWQPDRAHSVHNYTSYMYNRYLSHSTRISTTQKHHYMANIFYFELYTLPISGIIPCPSNPQ